jgi:hypothetical protein
LALTYLDVTCNNSKEFLLELPNLVSVQTLKLATKGFLLADRYPDLQNLIMYDVDGEISIPYLKEFIVKHKLLKSVMIFGMTNASYQLHYLDDTFVQIKIGCPNLKELIASTLTYSEVEKVDQLQDISEENVARIQAYRPRVESRFDMLSGYSLDSEWW